jgi:hypothetical protein
MLSKKTSIILVSLLAMILVACGSDRADTVAPIAVTNTPVPELTSTPEAAPSPTESEETEEMATATQEPEPTPTTAPTNTAVPTDTAVPSPTEEPETATEIDQELLLESLLTINDMPTGWSGTAATFEVREPGGTYTFACADLPARSTGQARVEFEKSSMGPFLQEAVIVYPTEEDAEDALADLSSAAQECQNWTDESGNDWTISPLSFPNFGDETFAARLQGTLEADTIYVREDNMVIHVLHGALAGVDSTLTEEMTTLTVEKFNETQ